VRDILHVPYFKTDLNLSSFIDNANYVYVFKRFIYAESAGLNTCLQVGYKRASKWGRGGYNSVDYMHIHTRT
jgi:hypothetical protein